MSCHTGVVTTPSSPSHPNDGTTGNANKRRPWDIPPGVAVVVAALIGLAGIWVGRASAATSGAPSPSVTTTITAAPRPTLKVANLGFALASPARIPWCNILDGTGAIPTGDVLLIFDTPAGPNGQPQSPPYYSFDGKATQVTKNSWQIKPVYIGQRYAKNFNAEIAGVLASDAVYQYILSIHVRNNQPWISEQLPPGQVIRLTVVTNGSGKQCEPKPA